MTRGPKKAPVKLQRPLSCFYLRTANGDGCVANHADTF